jgi:hypothetical protein
MTPARAEGTRAKATGFLLAGAWTAAVVFLWFGLFVPAMRPDAPGRIAIDLNGYFLPKYVYASTELAHGRLPLWNPYEFSGVPFLGMGQAAVLYPPRVLLFGLLPPLAALHAFMVGHYLALGAAAYLALRTLRLAVPGAALGALIVAFQPFMLHGHYAPHWIANFLWVPLAVAAFVRTIERASPAAALAFALAITCQVLAGYPEYALDTALALALLWPFVALRVLRERSRPDLVRGTALALTAGVVAALLSAVQWVPLLETYRTSVRAAGEYQFMFGMQFDLGAFGRGLRAWVAALSLLFYLPPIAWVALAAGLLVPGRPYRGAMLALAVLGFAAPSVLRTVPPFSMFRGPLCWVSILHLPLAALAGGGLDRLLCVAAENERGGGRAARLAGAGAALVALPLLRLRSVGWLALGLAGLAVARHVRVATAAVLLAALGAVLTWIPTSLPATARHRWAGGQPPYRNVAEAERLGRDVRRACGGGAKGRVVDPTGTWVGVPLLARLPSPQGYPESLAPERMSRLLAEAGLAPHTVFPLDAARLREAASVLRLLDVRCLVAPASWEPLAAALGYARGGTVFDGRVAFTRVGAGAWVVGATTLVPDGDAALAAVRAAGFRPDRRVVLERGGSERDGEPGRVELLGRGSPGHLRFRTLALQPSYLVVSEGWYPGWRARLDGVARLPVERADFTLLGVPVPAGAHDVELWYRPPGFAAAVAATAAGLLIALAAGAVVLGGGRR